MQPALWSPSTEGQAGARVSLGAWVCGTHKALGRAKDTPLPSMISVSAPTPTPSDWQPPSAAGVGPASCPALLLCPSTMEAREPTDKLYTHPPVPREVAGGKGGTGPQAEHQAVGSPFTSIWEHMGSHGSVAKWITCLITDQKTVGSTPASLALPFFFRAKSALVPAACPCLLSSTTPSCSKTGLR